MLAIGAASTQAKMIAVKGIVTDAKSKDPLFWVLLFILYVALLT